MFQKKYLIIIAVILCLLILYYFYDEISRIKKSFIPTYQKTMALEAKLMQLEKKTMELIPTQKKKLIGQKFESPALSITYNSDMIKNGNLSVKYSDLSETEAKDLLKKIENSKQSVTQINKNTQLPNIPKPDIQIPAEKNNFTGTGIQVGDFSDLISDKNTNNGKSKNNNEESDTINVKISDLIKKNTQQVDAESFEYEKILNDLTTNMGNITTENINDDELDTDIIKSISESIQYADLPSENTLSEIPLTPMKPNKNNKKTIQQKTKKSNKRQNQTHR